MTDSATKEVSDSPHAKKRVEARCLKCDGHFGRVFEEGPGPTGLRDCIHSAALGFGPEGPDENPEE